MTDTTARSAELISRMKTKVCSDQDTVAEFSLAADDAGLASVRREILEKLHARKIVLLWTEDDDPNFFLHSKVLVTVAQILIDMGVGQNERYIFLLAVHSRGLIFRKFVG